MCEQTLSRHYFCSGAIGSPGNPSPSAVDLLTCGHPGLLQGLNLSSEHEPLAVPLSRWLAFILIDLDHIVPFISMNSTDWILINNKVTYF